MPSRDSECFMRRNELVKVTKTCHKIRPHSIHTFSTMFPTCTWPRQNCSVSTSVRGTPHAWAEYFGVQARSSHRTSLRFDLFVCSWICAHGLLTALTPGDLPPSFGSHTQIRGGSYRHSLHSTVQLLRWNHCVWLLWPLGAHIPFRRIKINIASDFDKFHSW